MRNLLLRLRYSPIPIAIGIQQIAPTRIKIKKFIIMPKASSIPKNNEPTPNKEKKITTNSTIIALQSNKEIEDIRYILQNSKPLKDTANIVNN